MDSVDEIELPADINLVRFGKTELVTYKTQIKQSSNIKTNVCSLTSEDDENINQSLKCNDVLDRILPVREWEKDGKLYRQKISNQPTAKSDIKNLTTKLDMYLKQFNAREVGICPIKEQLYFLCFNEIIRQVTVNCAERGSMLIRVRDEIKNNLDSYQKLYESLIAYGIRKSLLNEEKKASLKEMRKKLMTENEKLELELAETIAKTENLKHNMAEANKAENTRHAKDLGDLKKANQVIRVQLESIIDPKNNVN